MAFDAPSHGRSDPGPSGAGKGHAVEFGRALDAVAAEFGPRTRRRLDALVRAHTGHFDAEFDLERLAAAARPDVVAAVTRFVAQGSAAGTA